MNKPAHISIRRQNLARLGLFSQAAANRPNDELCARRYARAAIELDDIDSCITALTQLVSIAPDDADAWCGLSELLLKRNRAVEAEEAGRKAVRLDRDNAQYLVFHGFALRALQRDDEADLAFERAYAADPLNRHAIRGVGQTLIRKREFVRLRQHIESAFMLIGPVSWIIAQYMIALAMLGDHKLLATLIDYDRHIANETIASPDGFRSLDHFNESLRAELAAVAHDHNGVALDVINQGQRIEGGVQLAIDLLGKQGAPASLALMNVANRQLEAYLQKMGDAFVVRYRPRNTTMRTDAIISDQQTSLSPHTHACSWVSMVYYLDVPDCIKEGNPAGCMEFCPPVHKADVPADCWPSRAITPRTGHMVLFPGYLYHKVNKMGAPGRRTAITFDMFPTQDSLLPGTSIGRWLNHPDQE